MTSEARTAGGVHILDFKGKICFSDGEQEFQKAVADCLAQGHKKIVLNFGHVKLIDSAGLGQMMAAKKRGLDRNAEFALVIPRDTPVPLVVQTCLQLVFHVFQDEVSAVGYFAK